MTPETNEIIYHLILVQIKVKEAAIERLPQGSSDTATFYLRAAMEAERSALIKQSELYKPDYL